MPRRLSYYVSIPLFAGLAAAAVAASGCTGGGEKSAGLGLVPTHRRQFISGQPTSSVPEALLKRAKLNASAAETDFDADRALADSRAIAEFGVRPGGSEAESLAADFIRGRLEEMGYESIVEEFELPNGKTTRNVSASVRGSGSRRQVILGAHFDTKPPAPGGNDNASGCGVALEIARQLARDPAVGEVRFVFFGTEEFLVDAPGDNHHLGSRFDAKRLSKADVDDVAAMVSLDMLGYGSRPYLRTMKRGPMTAVESLLAEAERQEIDLSYRKDPGKTGWSDHEPYEKRGIPVAWLQWLEDPAYHTKRDDAGHVRRRPLEVSGKLVIGWLRSLDSEALEKLCDR